MIQGIKRLGPFEWEVPVGLVPGMHAPGRFYLSDSLLQTLEEGAVLQLANVATMPGIIRYSLAMPDIHWGYGFPIGGVAAFSLEDGVISPGGVGFDINCGVRLLTTPLTVDTCSDRQGLIDELYQAVPTGVGARGSIRLSRKDLRGMMEQGARWAVDQGYGFMEDLERCEDGGCMKGALSDQVSDKAQQRGMPQSGTLGAGNHFLEVQVVGDIYDEPAARAYGLSKGQICIMIHCGSRGLGHQTCTDHLKILEMATKKYHISIPDRQLACAPITSPEGLNYYGAMAASANYAWANRQVIMHVTRTVLSRRYGIDEKEMHLLYDVAHNVAKKEEHVIDGAASRVCVHRKGATRAFGPGRVEIPLIFRETGQPVIIPGSMGSPSYVLKGTRDAMEKTFGSTCHGSGRVMSRAKAKKSFSGKVIRENLMKQGIVVRAPHDGAIVEEAPGVYKSSDEVVRVVDQVGLSLKVARLEPLGVIKG
jgi:tRNA-splicing ligase RtcB